MHTRLHMYSCSPQLMSMCVSLQSALMLKLVVHSFAASVRMTC